MFSSDDQFLIRVAALQDVYDVLGKGSKDMQNIQRLPWECESDYTATIDALISMASALAAISRSNPASTAEAMAAANFTDCWSNMKQYGVGATVKAQVSRLFQVLSLRLWLAH